MSFYYVYLIVVVVIRRRRRRRGRRRGRRRIIKKFGGKKTVGRLFVFYRIAIHSTEGYEGFFCLLDQERNFIHQRNQKIHYSLLGALLRHSNLSYLSS
jgi:hypothetical protein